MRIRQADLISSLTDSIIGKDENAALHDIAWYCGDPVAFDSPLNLGATSRLTLSLTLLFYVVLLFLDDTLAADNDSDDAHAYADAGAGATVARLVTDFCRSPLFSPLKCDVLPKPRMFHHFLVSKSDKVAFL